MALPGRPTTGSLPRAIPDGGSRGRGETTARRVVVLNPESGDATHAAGVRELAAEYGYAVRETERAGHAVDLTRQATDDGADLIAACGGDGTVNETVRGIAAADAFDDVTLGVLPGGTGNNFALNIGVETIEEGFEVLEAGRTRQVDVGMADGRPFANSCVGGLTARASSETSSDLKDRLGVLAYVVSTLRSLSDFEGIELVLASQGGDEPLWEGSAVCVLVGNARRVGDERVVQADMEDGLLDVTIVESMPPSELLETAAVYQLFGEDRDAITRLTTPSLDVEVRETESAEFSLDGEILHAEHLSMSVRPGALSLRVGEAYDPHPDGTA